MSHLPPRPGLGAGLARLGRLTRKELYESLRDRRTLMTLVLMPLLLYPVLGLAFSQMAQYRRVEMEWSDFNVAVAGIDKDGELVPTDEGLTVRALWEKGEKHRMQRHTPPGKPADDRTVPTYLEFVPRLWIRPKLDVEAAVRAGEADVGVRLRRPEAKIHPGPIPLGFVDFEVFYPQDSRKGHDAARHLELLIADANAALIEEGLARIGVEQRGDPVRLRVVAVADESSQRASTFLLLVPLILILMTITGAVYPAIDLTAGERERGTLEVLMAAPIPRLSVLLAKYFAVLAVATLTALVNLGSMALTLQITEFGRRVIGGGMSVGVMLQVFVLLLLFSSFFSAILLTLTSFARSFKEAQAYLIPLMIFCLIPGVLALSGLTLSVVTAVVPLVNIVLLARDVFTGSARPLLAGLVVLSTLAYALAAIALASRVFGTEAVLAAEAGTLGDLFRFRRRPPRQ